MADAKDLDFTYTQIDRLVRLSMGELADFSGAKYDGDFSISLEEAQRRKHAFTVKSVGVRPGSRVLDLGCGWGGFLSFARALGAKGVGVSLSQGQVASCRRHGLDVHLMDLREVTPQTFGTFDAVVSVGSFEAYCSREQYAAGEQDAIYARLFRSVHALLPPGGRFFVQTMVFGRNMIPPERIDIDATPRSDEHALASMAAQFPGSWLPFGKEQLVKCAAPSFRLVSAESGRLDYIETIRQWEVRFAKRSLKKFAVLLSLAPKYLTSRRFRQAFASGYNPNVVCFQRELLDHFRLVFQRD